MILALGFHLALSWFEWGWNVGEPEEEQIAVTNAATRMSQYHKNSTSNAPPREATNDNTRHITSKISMLDSQYLAHKTVF